MLAYAVDKMNKIVMAPITLRRFQVLPQTVVRRFLCLQTSTTRDTSVRPPKLMPGNWQPVIGLEIHAQINANSKLFSGAATKFHASTNTQVAPHDAALPGTLPVINRYCVTAAVATGLALNCHINLVSAFDRKHYIYSDLPAGYQITQHRSPVAVRGHIEYIQFQPAVYKYATRRRVNITQIQLEQDSGRSLHGRAPAGTEQISLIDLNRAGIGLLEIITEPEIEDGEDAAALIKELSMILREINVCDCRMEEGSLRVDANISVKQADQSELGVRTEVKNLNSIRSVVNAIEYEIRRQVGVLQQGGVVDNDTMTFDIDSGQTLSLRDKERRQEYRHLPEPNLPPLHLTTDSAVRGTDSAVRGSDGAVRGSDDAVRSDDSAVRDTDSAVRGSGSAVRGKVNVDEVRRQLPTVVQNLSQCREQLMGAPHNLRLEQVAVLTADLSWLRYYLGIMGTDGEVNGRLAYRFLMLDVLRCANRDNLASLHHFQVGAGRVRDIVMLQQDYRITQDTGSKVLDMLCNGDTRSVRQIVTDNDWFLIADRGAVEQACHRVVEKHPWLLHAYLHRSEKKQARAYKNMHRLLVENTGGRVEHRLSTQVLKQVLEGYRRRDSSKENTGKS